jgi:putative colanic acid biosynthesis glycosyltransferase
MEAPLISIIIPVFNASDTIDDCLKSAINQTWQKREIIVIDGGSNSSTIEKINKCSGQITHFISEPDHGVYDAINKGIDKSKGDWIFILGADDQLANDRVLEDVFSTPLISEKIVFGCVEQTEISHPLVKHVHKSKFNIEIYWRNTLHQQSVFYNKNLFYNFRFNTQYRVLADYDFHLMLYRQKAIYRELPLTIAVCKAGGLSKQFTVALYLEEIQIKKQRLNWMLFLINWFWVWMKYLAKKIFS